MQPNPLKATPYTAIMGRHCQLINTKHMTDEMNPTTPVTPAPEGTEDTPVVTPAPEGEPTPEPAAPETEGDTPMV